MIQSEGLAARGANDVYSSARTGEHEMKCPSSSIEAGTRGGEFFLPPTVLFRPSMNCMMFTTLGGSSTEAANSQDNLVWKCPQDTSQNNV